MKKDFLMLLFALLTPALGMAQVYQIAEMNSRQLEELDKDKTIVIIPGGIIEGHGPYLPTFSDGYINESLSGDISKFLAEEKGLQVLLFPTIPLGSSGNHLLSKNGPQYGTFALRDVIMRDVFLDLGTALGEQGFRQILVIHNHGGPGHNQAIDHAATYFEDTYGGKMINCWNLLFYAPQTEKRPEELQEEGFISHAGMEETSILLHLHPQLVQADFKEALPYPVEDTRHMIEMARVEFWPGYFGSPRLANLAFGEKAYGHLLGHLKEEVGKILEGTFDFSQPTYYQIIQEDPAMQKAIEDAHARDEEKTRRYQQWLERGLNEN